MGYHSAALGDTSPESPHKHSLLAKSLAHTLPRSNSLLSFISRKASLRHRRRRSISQQSSGSSREGTFSLLSSSYDTVGMASNRERKKSVDIPQHTLMRPMQPQIPKSKTFGSLETSLLYVTPESSPNRSNQASISPIKSIHSTSESFTSMPYPLRDRQSFGYDREAGPLLQNPPISFQRPAQPTFNNPGRPQMPLTRQTTSSSVRPNPQVDTFARNHGIQRRESSAVTSRLPTTEDAARRSTLSPSLTNTQLPTNTRVPVREQSLRPRRGTTGVPPLPFVVQSMTALVAPRPDLAVATSVRHTSSRIANTSSRHKSRIPTPAHTAAHGRRTSNSSIVHVSSAAGSTRTPSENYVTPPGVRPLQSRPSRANGQNRNITGAARPSTFVTPSRASSGFSDELNALSHTILGSPTPRAGRYAHRGALDDIPPIPDSPPQHLSSPIENLSTTDPTRTAPRHSSNATHRVMPRTFPPGTVFDDHPPSWWLGRYTSVSDRLRTEEMQVKAQVAAGQGDPGAKNHPANTGMMDDAKRKQHVLDYLATTCGSDNAKDSFAIFIRQFNENQRTAEGGGRAKSKQAAGGGGFKGKVNVFERLGMRKRSNTGMVG